MPRQPRRSCAEHFSALKITEISSSLTNRIKELRFHISDCLRFEALPRQPRPSCAEHFAALKITKISSSLTNRIKELRFHTSSPYQSAWLVFSILSRLHRAPSLYNRIKGLRFHISGC